MIRPPEPPPAPAMSEMHLVWVTAGLGCDGDTIAMTAATQPSIEDLVRGVLPGVPKVRLHNPVLAHENGDEFLSVMRRAAEGRLDPFILVFEGSVPDEKLSGEGYWAALGDDPQTGQPMSTCTWIDRLAPRAWAVMATGTCATYGGIHAMAGNPTGCMGLADYLGWTWRSAANIPIVCVPGCPIQPDNFMETLLAGLLGPGRAVQRGPARLDGRRRRLPERRRRLHRLHDARLSRQVHVVHGRASRRAHVDLGGGALRPDGARAQPVHAGLHEPGAGMAHFGPRAARRPRPRPRRERVLAAMAAGTNLVDMSWDPITRVIGSLGIHTKIDFANRQVAECRTTSSIFRGYSVFMKGKDPRDAHFITSRICGICGDNHATCAVYAQNMAFGVNPPWLADWIINCGEAAE
jgi:hypothetical protein